MLKLELLAPAKINLSLNILGLAENGYHEVDMIMQTISIYEHIEIAKSRGFYLRLPKSRVPVNNKNTALKAAEAFFYETGLLAGAEITIHKTVPTRAGLAGGSADAAAVLVGLNTLYNAKLSQEKLCEIGLKVGADVPFSIIGGTARANGIGEKLKPLAPLVECFFAVLMPFGRGVSTPEAYRQYDALQNPLHPSVDEAQQAIQNQNLSALFSHMQNSLQQASGNATTQELCNALCLHGAKAAMMTGSGAAVFGVFLTEKEAKNAVSVLRLHCSDAFFAVPVNHGPIISKQIG